MNSIRKIGVTWEKSNVRSKISSKAVPGGRDTDGSVLIVGRTIHNNVYLPCKILPNKNACYVGE